MREDHSLTVSLRCRPTGRRAAPLLAPHRACQRRTAEAALRVRARPVAGAAARAAGYAPGGCGQGPPGHATTALRRRGRLAMLPLDAVTSARRYLAHGPFRTWLRHAIALTG